MPFHIESKGDEFEVVDDKGKSYGVHKTRQQAIDQQRALYAAVPEASKKEAAEVTEKASDNPGDYLIVEDREKPTTWHLQVRKNGKPDHGLMGGAWAALHEGYRGNKYEGPNKGEAISKLKKMYDAEKMDTPAAKEASEPSALDRIMGLFGITTKGDVPGHEFHGNQYSEGGGSGGGGSGSGDGGSGDSGSSCAM